MVFSDVSGRGTAAAHAEATIDSANLRAAPVARRWSLLSFFHEPSENEREERKFCVLFFIVCLEPMCRKIRFSLQFAASEWHKPEAYLVLA